MGGLVTGGATGGTGAATGGTGGGAVDAAKGGGVGGRRELLPARLMGVPSAR